jgi:hypothetical protein
LWIHVLRVPLGALGFAVSAVFYIRWNDQWFRQHADEEFRLRQLELDVDRASWVTELALEFRDEKGEIPSGLIERLSNGLFTSFRKTEPVQHPSEDLVSLLLGASSGLRVNVPGIGEATLSRKGLQKFKQEATDT